MEKIQEQLDIFEKLEKAEINYKKSPKHRITKCYLETRIESADELWTVFKKNHRELISKITKENKGDPYFTNDVYDSFEELFISYKCALKEALQPFLSTVDVMPAGSSTAAVPLIATSSACEVKLPRIQLPTFTGKYTEWQTFYDMFVSLIHENKSLTSVQKLHYLKSSLSGEPENLIRNFSTTDLNYLEAWQQLTRRYNNKKYNCNAIMKTLFAIKQINTESASDIKRLLDITSSSLKALDNIGVSTKSWDAIIVYHVVSKLDPESHKQWESQQSKSDDMPTWHQLAEFLESRFRSLEMIDASRQSTRSSNLSQSTPKYVAKPKTFHSSVQEEKKANDILCPMCNGQHLLYQCKQFSQEAVNNRQDFVQSKGLCFNCFAPTHSVKKCRQSTCCRRCGRRHHSLLHFDKSDNQGSTNNDENAHTEQHKEDKNQCRINTSSAETRIISNFSKGELQSYKVLLATATVNAKSRNGCNYVLRALVDQGSQASFVTEATVQLLGLKRLPVNGLVSGLGDGQTRVKYMVSLKVESRHHPEKSIQVTAYVLSSLTSMLPTSQISPDWLELEEIPLADPGFTSPGKIDVLLGAEVYGEILTLGMIKNPQGNLIAQNTILGWIISGKVSQEANSTNDNVVSMHVRVRDDDLLKKFWEMENEPDSIERKLTKSELKCEELYDKTTVRNEEGRFVVRLPFESEDPECQYGQTRNIAEKRLRFLEKRLSKDPNLYAEYRKVMEEYKTLNHMKVVKKEEIDDPKAVYLPHHAVVREDKDTTKVRVVFNASCKGVNNVSLNDNLLVGPKLQQDLRHLLMRWRHHRICIIADLVKMYRQVLVDKEDTNYQRIVWREHPEEPIQHYKLLTLTFGTACAPYLAVKTLQRLAEDEQSKFPVAAEITKRDYYIDDLMSGCDTEKEAIQIFEEMNQLMASGGFQLQKGSSNNEEVLEQIGKDKRNSNQSVPIKMDNKVKVLGICWNKETDNFEYTVNLPETKHPITKRQVLSDIARLYDPMGWIAPVVIKAKEFMQTLWKEQLDWDDELNQELLGIWTKYREELDEIKDVLIPRWYHSYPDCRYELHAFSDASRAAYAAVVYLRVTDTENRIHVNLVTAKTKVAPIEKEVSIPRLELCGAALAAKLLHEVAQVMSIPKENQYAWTDSTVVLAWLKGTPSRWTTFVSNRVSNILNILDYDQWGHVSTHSNPADCASRGCKPAELINNSLWWTGPKWLSDPMGVNTEKSAVTDTHEEERIKTFTVQEEKTKEYVWEKFSNLQKMLRVMSFCRRILNNKQPRDKRINFPKYVTTEEMKQVLEICIKQVQADEFGEEIKQLKTRGYVAKKSVLHTLYPIFDANGILRIGGRIDQANASFDKRHPVVLSAKNHLSKLIISDAHVRTLHGGPQIMLNYLRSKYWIVRARDQVKKHYRDCVVCKRYSKTANTQLMGQIPEVRLKPSKPFKSTGVDYAGPINIRFSPGRGSKSYKGYICLFICMVTRAIHLEAVTNLTSKGFIAAFRRFTSRRGHCKDLFSDNGTNFVGADRQLKDMFNEAKSELPHEIAETLTLENTTWHFIPPQAPNFGGLWEAGVRCAKNHLRKVIGDSTLTYEELSTVLTQVEACLNSRPLSVLSDDPNDPLPLTPGHFLVGEPLLNVVDQDYSTVNVTGLDRWKLVQKMVNDFWKRWSKEYLVNLNQRYKWSTKKCEPDIGDVVVIKDDNVPPAKWILGLVIDKHVGPDNITRVVTIKCKNGYFKRAINKICVLTK